jgi:hypothetical protein
MQQKVRYCKMATKRNALWQFFALRKEREREIRDPCEAYVSLGSLNVAVKKTQLVKESAAEWDVAY